MFIRSYERGERVYDAMLARGYTGEMPDLRSHQPSTQDWIVGSVLPGIALLVATLAWVIS